MDNFVQIIKDLGFPIACVIALFWMVIRQSDQHKEEMQAMSEALNNNTKALVRLEEKIGGLEKHDS